MNRTEIIAKLTPDCRSYVEGSNLDAGVSAEGTVVIKTVCGRCGGSGQFSRCEGYGTRCFACNVASGGKCIGFVWIDAENHWKSIKRSEKAAAKRAAEWEAGREAREAAEAQRIAQEAAKKATAEQVKAERLEKLEYVGEVGKRGEFEVLVKGCASWLASYNGSRPVENRWYRLEDADGNVLGWKTSSGYLPINDVLRIAGTVKAHEVSKKHGEKTTILLRVKVLENISETARATESVDAV